MVRSAAETLWQSVVEACKIDLTTEVRVEGPAQVTVLRVCRYLDDDCWIQLRGTAEQVVVSSIRPYELAGRFIGVSFIEADRCVAEHYLETFEKLIPREQWDLDSIPVVTEAEAYPCDQSLAGRIRFAAYVMREILTDENPARAS